MVGCLDTLNPRLWSAAQRGLVPRTLALWRYRDVSGKSGLDLVAVGCQLPSGKIVIEWLSPPRGVNLYDDLTGLGIHGHEGETEIIWGDDCS